ncbi:MAG: DUF1653 domain-containing protein [Defluviitaleaceae bacterium]|nr:DUF1653 domain-containing protein [Defluviitaleaceae bacterium]
MTEIKLGKHISFDGIEHSAISTAIHSQTHEVLVIYQAPDENETWACPASSWSELVEHDGRKVKRFTHIDDMIPIVEESREIPEGIHNYSKPAEKVQLFLSLFTGRSDVYAKRWESYKTGRSGYSPDCNNTWTPLCPKTEKKKIKCSECSRQRFKPYDESAVESHLVGDSTIGVYPMLPDETCRFLAFDFDAKDYNPDDLNRDVAAIRDVCDEIGVSMAIERSRSGKGIHFWILFVENIPASVARKFGSSLITYAMNKHHSLSFKTYDRLIPTQDSLPKGGFGNLIALPLQKHPRNQDNSVFIDSNFNAYPDQWNFLYHVQKYNLSEIEKFIRQLSPDGDLGELQKTSDSEDEKPWETKQISKAKLTTTDFPDKVKIVHANMLYVEKSGIKSPALNILKRMAAFRNPEFYKAQAMRLSTHNKPRIINCGAETEQYMCLPRGLKDDVCNFFNEYDVKTEHIDEANNGRTIDVNFAGELRGEQQQASDALLAHDNGILSATTAFGKTVVGAYLIASRKVNTLILVHRSNLLTQWIDRLNEFLQINEEPDPEFTPTGRRKKKSVVGQIGGGKTSLSGIVDVAIMQSLVSGDEVKELVKNYGMVIVDECHRGAAFSFEQILKATNAKYVYGLTATPTRKDGHHPIIYMHCGKIRYRVDAKQQAEERPFEHFLIPRFTRFQKPVHRDGDKWEIQDVYTDIQNSEIRNNLIVQDVVAAVEQGRNPIILTERTEHVAILADILSSQLKNVITLTGGLSQKQSREALQNVANIPANESFVLVATGKYVGEGFDMPRLDTLFLAMPISWTGTVQQYAGRLHRLFDGKNEVQIYDYVDVHVQMLEKMHQKRLRSYASIGYKVKDTVPSIEQVHSIFNRKTFFPVYVTDILAAKTEVVIVSPFLYQNRILSELSHLATTAAKVTVITNLPDRYSDEKKEKMNSCITILTNSGVSVKCKDRIHQKFAVIDQRLVWYGSINLLSYGASEESIMRIESVDIAEELLRGVLM